LGLLISANQAPSAVSQWHLRSDPISERMAAATCISALTGTGRWNVSGIESTTDSTRRASEPARAERTARPARAASGERAAVSIHVSSPRGTLRRVVLSCDVAGCPVQVEPPAAEQWRSDPDARSWARDHAVGWTYDPERKTDYCPAHAELSTVPAADVIPPRPTASIRDRAGNPLNRDEYAVRLWARLSDGDRSVGQAVTLTAAEAAVVARLLDELAGVYRGESLGTVAHELSVLLGSRLAGRI
jgi:hypothetical protein